MDPIENSLNRSTVSRDYSQVVKHEKDEGRGERG